MSILRKSLVSIILFFVLLPLGRSSFLYASNEEIASTNVNHHLPTELPTDPISKFLLSIDNLVNSTRIGMAGYHYEKQEFSFKHFDLDSISTCFALKPFPDSIDLNQTYFKDEEFINYLLGNNLSHDAVYYLYGSNFAPSDTLSFYKGLSLYTAGALQDATKELALIQKESPYFEKAVFYGAVCDAYTGDYQHARQRLELYNGPRSELKAYQLAAFSLLENDLQAYKQHSSQFAFDSYAYSEGAQIMDRIYKERVEFKSKSPLAAAAMSAVVPGLGKIYAGFPGQGVASFLTVGTLTAFAVENWQKHGGSDWRSILFTTLAGVFHIAGIYGSYFSVDIYNTNLRDAQNQTIIFNIHLPIRSLFK